MKAVIDVIDALRGLAEGGSRSERQLAQLVLSDIGAAIRAPIGDLAREAGVSEPTVTRFARALGCSGTRDFKLKLAQGMALGAIYLAPPPPEPDNRPEATAAYVADAARSAIDRTAASLDAALIARLARRIAEAGRICIIGSGGTSSMMAVELQNRLFRFGLPAVAQVDGQMQRMQAALSSGTTFLVAFSISGNTRSVIDATRAARQYGARTLALTAPGSALAHAAETVLPFEVPEDGMIFKPSSSRYGLLLMVDVLATLVGNAVGAPAVEGMRRMKQALGTMQPGDPMRPLGD